ncbi:alpha amylase C-terminal domain-containing protein [Salinicola rhizosphaerae]|uniref:Alpha-amylase/branching enzyme C-terminal all beta domain-containing protein n=1 Tax=Salinicola rhizosphaerae TaxID=1443141 RepID=A0ABQ3DWR0_9GAMM|nr:alpha amylase C-terminal domain-containing protein [Salinicola rhizosphaerae]GHB15936.1 hypothetical protein GCM10009038_12840 [Salinicola rhizosphaerae]
MPATSSGRLGLASEAGVDVASEVDIDGEGASAWPWDDGDWMAARGARHGGELPLSFYRLEAMGWYLSRFTGPLNWERLAHELVPYVADLGFTHIVLDAALHEYPTAVVCRFVETCHVAGVGVLVRASHGDSESAAERWCRRCHIDGVERHDETSQVSRFWLFLDDHARERIELHGRDRWHLAAAEYLAWSITERCDRHAVWVAGLTPTESDRGVLEHSSDIRPAYRGRVLGEDWQRFATMRTCLALMWALPGDKLIAMGGELGQSLAPPTHEAICWPLLFESEHAGILRMVADLNRLYVNEPALQIRDDERLGFEWLVEDDHDNCVIVFARHAQSGHASLVCVCNFQPCVHYGYRLGAPSAGRWREIFNSDSVFFAGSNVGNGRLLSTEPLASHGHAQSLSLTVPPMAAIFLRHEVWYEDSP